jgi:hypothetical protein
MTRNYYVCSVGAPSEDYDNEYLLRCITKNCFVLHESNIHKGCISEITKNDILLLKYKEHLIAYGRVVSPLSKDQDISEGDGWCWTVQVNTWIVGNHAHRYGIGAAQESGSTYDTVKKVDREFALDKIEKIGFTF